MDWAELEAVPTLFWYVLPPSNEYEIRKWSICEVLPVTFQLIVCATPSAQFSPPFGVTTVTAGADAVTTICTCTLSPKGWSPLASDEYIRQVSGYVPAAAGVVIEIVNVPVPPGATELWFNCA